MVYFRGERKRASTAYSSRIGSSTVTSRDVVAVATPFRSTRSLPLPEHVASVTAISSSTPDDGLESLRQSLGCNLIVRRLKASYFHSHPRRPKQNGRRDAELTQSRGGRRAGKVVTKDLNPNPLMFSASLSHLCASASSCLWFFSSPVVPQRNR